MKTKEKIVKTISGEEVPIEKCKLIKGNYYKIGVNTIENSGDCYIIDNIPYPSEEVVFISTNEGSSYFLKTNPSIKKGIVAFNNNKKVIGFFKKSIFTTKVVESDGSIIDLSDLRILMNKNVPYYYDSSKEMFFSIVHLKIKNKISFKKNINDNIKSRFPYSATKEYIDSFSSNYNKQSKITYKKNNNYNFFSKLLNNTYGFEFETSKGLIPNKFLYETGLMPLRDGSIGGIEYATIPYSGVTGLVNLKKVCEYLELFTEKDDRCSMHIHIGGLKRDIPQILAFLKLVVFTQDEFYKMFPLYKKYHFEYKNKSYTQPYPEFIKQILAQPLKTKEDQLSAFDQIFTYLSQGRNFNQYRNDLNNVKTHPSDPENRQKWNIRTRYHIVNVIPLIFGNKQTVEFRIHTPTYDFNKLFYFLNIIDSLVVLSNNAHELILADNYYVKGDRDLLSNLLHFKFQSQSQNEKPSLREITSLLEITNDYFNKRKKVIGAYHRANNNFPNEDESQTYPFYRLGSNEPSVRIQNLVKTKAGSKEDSFLEEELIKIQTEREDFHKRIDEFERAAIKYKKLDLDIKDIYSAVTMNMEADSTKMIYKKYDE